MSGTQVSTLKFPQMARQCRRSDVGEKRKKHNPN